MGIKKTLHQNVSMSLLVPYEHLVNEQEKQLRTPMDSERVDIRI